MIALFRACKGHHEKVRFLKLVILMLLGVSAIPHFPSLGDAHANNPIPDYSIIIEPNHLTVDAGFSANSTISVTSLNGFSGPVSLQANDSSILGLDQLSMSLKPSTLNLKSGQTQASILTISPTASETFNFNIAVTGTSGSISHFSTLLAQVVSLGIGPWGGAYLGVYPGLTITGGVRLYSYNGFQGNVTLARSVSPTVSNGPIVTLRPSQLYLPENDEADLTILTQSNTPNDNYTIRVTATQGQLSVSTTIIVNVSSQLTPDFDLSAYYTGMTAHAGTPDSLELIMFSENGFAATLSLSASIYPVVSHGPKISFTNSSVTLVGSNFGYSSMVVYTDQFTPEQTYSVIIAATGGGRSHSLREYLEVLGPWYTLSTQPSIFTVEQGSNFSVLITEGSPDRFFGTISMSGTVAPAKNSNLSIAFSPEAFSSEGFYVGSSTLIVYANQSTPLGTYTINVTGTSGPTIYWFTIAVNVIPPSPKGYLYYAVAYEGLPYPGGETTLLNNFTDAGNVPMKVTGLSFASDFGTFDESATFPLQLKPGESLLLDFVISIPTGTSPGNHRITATVKWEYYNPQLSDWNVSTPLVVTGQLSIAQAPSPPPPTQSRHPTPIPDIRLGILQALSRVANLGPGTLWTTIALAGAAYASLVFMIVLILLRRERVASSFLQTAPSQGVVICPSCNLMVPSQARFCSRCGGMLS